MKKNYILRLFAFLLVLNFACKDGTLEDCFTSTGKIVTEDRMVAGGFKTITVYDNINLIFTYDSVASIKVEAGNNLLSDIAIEVQDSVLVLHNNNRCNWVRSFDIPVNIYVHSNTVTKFIGRNTGNITSTNTIKVPIFNFEGWMSNHFDLTLDCNELDCSLNLDACDATLHGHADNCFLWTAGNGFFHGEDFVADFMSVYSKSTGDTYVNVSGILWVKLLDIGWVYYKGNPVVTSTITGTGKLVKQ